MYKKCYIAKENHEVMRFQACIISSSITDELSFGARVAENRARLQGRNFRMVTRTLQP
jgi:hypothetical protein